MENLVSMFPCTDGFSAVGVRYRIANYSHVVHAQQKVMCTHKGVPSLIIGGVARPLCANDDAQYPPVSVRISWTRLLMRVFDIGIEQCPHCGRTLKIIAAILEKAAITKILDHRGLPARVSPSPNIAREEVAIPL